MKAIHYFILLIIIASCSAANKSLPEVKARERMKALDEEAQNNINTLIGMIEDEALETDPTAKHYIPYEFRIPLDTVKRNEVHRIDSSVQFTARQEYYQCISGHATKEKVFQIVALPYTTRVQFCPYE